MKNNYRIIVFYDGTGYSGWQYQHPPIRTVQGEIFRILKIIAKKRVIVTGSSRTDAGVHSTGLTANFHLPINIKAESLQLAMNSLLPRDIRISSCEKCDPSFNARFGARSKTYEYRIFFGQVLSPFDCRTMTHIPYPLDLKAMKKSVRHFIGEKDFTSFTSDIPEKNKIREVTHFKMKVKNQQITFTIRGRSFLRYMVRNMVGTIIDVGRGKIAPADIPDIFAARDRREAGRTAPPQGLILRKVEY